MDDRKASRMLRSIVRRMPGSLKTYLQSKMRSRERHAYAMNYYKDQLKFMNAWANKDTEDHNYYYKLTERNRDHLAHLIACITGNSHSTVTSYFDELDKDERLRSHIATALKSLDYGREIQVDYARRLGWYAFARILKPQIIVETGVDHGVGSCVLASALLRNAVEGHPGGYYGTDINLKAGKLFSGEYATTGKILYGDSIESLKTLNEPIDLFVNDSDHSAEYEYSEYRVIASKLSDRSVILGDNAHGSDSLSRFSIETNRQFIFFSEKPANHWYPGAGIGISFHKK